MPSEVWTLVLNWNGREDTLDLMRSLSEYASDSNQIVVLDNASSDDSYIFVKDGMAAFGWSLERVEKGPSGTKLPGRKPKTAWWVESDTNLGFAGGNNKLLELFLMSPRETRFAWILNNDTLVEPGSLEALKSALVENDRVGASQSLLLNHQSKDLIDSAGIRLRTRGGACDDLQGRSASTIAGSPERPEIFGCCGASMLMERSTLEAVGAFDPSYFAVNEDVDLACRLRVRGYRSVLALNSIVYHKRGVSSKSKRGYIWYIARRNKTRNLSRWWPRSYAIPLVTMEMLRLLVSVHRYPEESIGSWIALTREVVTSLFSGATGSQRRSLLRHGRKSLLDKLHA